VTTAEKSEKKKTPTQSVAGGKAAAREQPSAEVRKERKGKAVERKREVDSSFWAVGSAAMLGAGCDARCTSWQVGRKKKNACCAGTVASRGLEEPALLSRLLGEPRSFQLQLQFPKVDRLV
jgi:hypothetical protein